MTQPNQTLVNLGGADKLLKVRQGYEIFHGQRF
jgi:hypothetical protein